MPYAEPVDAAHLQSYTLGDPGLEAELAAIFRQQATDLRARILREPSRAARLQALHTLKGAAASLGAFDLAARCRDAEGALEAQGRAGRAGYAVEEVCNALDAVLMHLEERVARARDLGDRPTRDWRASTS